MPLARQIMRSVRTFAHQATPPEEKSKGFLNALSTAAWVCVPVIPVIWLMYRNRQEGASQYEL